MDELRTTPIHAPANTETPSNLGSPSEAPVSPGRKLFRHASNYSIASLLSVIAGLVTFPLLTRTLTVADYGLLSLLAATLGFAVALAKTGLQHALIRYFTEIAAGKSPFLLKQLYATALLGMLASSFVAMVVLSVGAQFAPSRWLGDERVRPLLAIVALLAVVESLDSGMTNLLVADQRSSAVLRYQFTKKYLGLGAMVVALLLIAPTLTAFWWARVVAESTALAVPAWFLFAKRRQLLPRLASFSGALYKKLLAFGLPMAVGYELSGVILNLGDRYVIHALIGETELGLYSAAYNLCQYVQSVFVSSLGLAIMPLYMRMWDEEGPQKAAAFVTSSLRSYILLGAPIVGGLASIGPELLSSLASERYGSVGYVLPWIVAGMIIDGVGNFMGAGLFVRRKANTISVIVFGSAAFNIALNLLLVPRLGVLGAAISTIGSYAVLCVAFSWRGRRLLEIRFPWKTAIRAALAAVVMYLVLRYLLPGRGLLSVGARAALGVPLYLGLITALDPDARRLASSVRRSLRAQISVRMRG